MRSVRLREYRDLLQAFASGRMAGSEFEPRYLTLFKEDEARRPRAESEVLDALLGDVENKLDEAALRQRVAAAIERLDTPGDRR
jgi:self-protective colicin-like immunity protein